jgi:hypothetical protein
MVIGVQRYIPTTRPLGNRSGTLCTGGWVDPRAGMDGCGKSRPSGIRSLDRPACSVSLYRLSYPGPQFGILSITRDPSADNMAASLCVNEKII